MQDFEEHMLPEDTAKYESDSYYAAWFWLNEENDYFRWPTYIAKCRMYDQQAEVTSVTYNRSIV